MLGQFGKLLRAVVDGPDPSSIPPPREILPTIDLSHPPTDWYWNADIYLYTGYASEAAGAGVKSMVALSNPVDSQTLVTVEKIRARSADDNVYLRMAVASNLAAFDSDGTEYTRDPRTYRSLIAPQPSRGPAATVLSDQAAGAGQAAALLIADWVDGAGKYTFTETSEFVLMPGTGLVVSPAADNMDCIANFYWRERRYDGGEARGTPFV